jgi:hypothetical protein
VSGRGSEEEQERCGFGQSQSPTWSPTLRSMAAAGDPGLILLMTTYVCVCGGGGGEAFCVAK